MSKRSFDIRDWQAVPNAFRPFKAEHTENILPWECSLNGESASKSFDAALFSVLYLIYLNRTKQRFKKLFQHKNNLIGKLIIFTY